MDIKSRHYLNALCRGIQVQQREFQRVPNAYITADLLQKVTNWCRLYYAGIVMYCIYLYL